MALSLAVGKHSLAGDGFAGLVVNDRGLFHMLLFALSMWNTPLHDLCECQHSSLTGTGALACGLAMQALSLSPGYCTASALSEPAHWHCMALLDHI